MNFTSRVFSLFSTTTTTAAASSPSSSSDTPASQDSSSRQQQQQSLSNGGFRSMAAAVAGGVEDYDDNGGGGDGGQRQIGNIVEGEEAQMQAPMRSMEEEESRPPYLHAMFAGGIGGTCGDMLMHSLDTVKTRQQGDPHIPPKYTSMAASYATIYRQEGLLRGLYGGVTPALMGSFPGTVIFFGVYEFTKRKMLDAGINANVAYLSGGFFADLAASIVYVPSEVLKTRLQLQGRYNNPYFNSGYNYRSTADAFRTIVRQEGFSALFYGYKATIFRDLPFSALQFAFYEQEHDLAKQWVGHRDIGLGLEILTAATAGGMAGVMTCPLDVVKTRIQTQQNPDSNGGSSSSAASSAPSRGKIEHALGNDNQSPRQHNKNPTSPSNVRAHARPISTSSPSTSVPPPGAPRLDTSSVFTGLKLIYQTEGIAGWFRGVGPRGVWTSIQSGTMLVLYQYLLKKFEAWRGNTDVEPL